MNLDLSKLTAAEKEIQELIHNNYVDPAKKSEPIYDGVVSPNEYLSAKKRILWILKEPYDGKDGYGPGGWSITEALLREKTHETARGPSFQPICYINHGIFSGIDKWADLPWLRDSPEMRESLLKIAFINASKLPGLNFSPTKRVKVGYEANSKVILKQIEDYAPEIIFACDPHINLIMRDLGVDKPNWRRFDSAFAYPLTENQRIVWVFHPNQKKKGLTRERYVNEAILAATAPLESHNGEL